MQPLSRIRPDIRFVFGLNRDFASKPLLACKIAECIALWADIETMLGILLAILLDANSDAALNMFAEVDNRASQLKMLDAAAKAKMNQDQHDVFTVLMSTTIKPAMKDRDKLAHWCWASTPDLDSFLLTEPHFKMTHHMRAITDSFSDVDPKTIYAVNIDDLTRMLNRFRQAADRLSSLMASLWKNVPPLEQKKLFEQLSNEPQIREGLTHLRDERNENPAALCGTPQPNPNGGL